MIFVITGTESFQFNRLIEKVDAMKASGEIAEDVFIQLGSCTFEPKHCGFSRWLSFGAMREHIATARIVIAHAGAGTTLLCLEMGKTPLLVTRSKKFGEHLDDHQIPFARRMDSQGFAVVAFDVEDLPECYRRLSSFQAKEKDVTNKSALVAYLNDWFAR